MEKKQHFILTNFTTWCRKDNKLTFQIHILPPLLVALNSVLLVKVLENSVKNEIFLKNQKYGNYRIKDITNLLFQTMKTKYYMCVLTWHY